MYLNEAISMNIIGNEINSIFVELGNTNDEMIIEEKSEQKFCKKKNLNKKGKNVEQY